MWVRRTTSSRPPENPLRCCSVARARAAIVAAAGAETAAAAATATARLALFSDVDAPGAAVEIHSVHSGDGSLRIRVVGHADEAETARTAAVAIDHDLGFDDLA